MSFVGLRFIFMPAAGGGGIVYCGRMSGCQSIVRPSVCVWLSVH